MAGDAGQEAVLAEQRLQVRRRHSAIRAGGTQTSSTISAVPGRPQPPDQPVQALADAPVDLDRSASRVNSGAADQLVPPARTSRRLLLHGVELGVVVAAELDQQRGRLGRQLGQYSGVPGIE